VNCLDKDLG